MMRLPPGEPMAMTSRPSRPSTRVGDIELRGRLLASTRLATGRPSARGAKEKSASSLFSMKPRALRCEPKAPSVMAVKAPALPWASNTEGRMEEDRVVKEVVSQGKCGGWRILLQNKMKTEKYQSW